ncbi:uncharacterized protein [Arachis hypogaea]|uniref:uncharacterized protein n=1 Tax=Arachis hypogaea TaxID=3818 RepID=UPI000DEC6186|nr:uncharacterized protein LOC112743464 [Arachis hypogaea]XP_025693206.1 uncharacterized protein LOC112795491 [Arachis hypogaea]
MLSTIPNIATPLQQRTLSPLPNDDSSAQSRCTPLRTATARCSPRRERCSIARNPYPFSSPSYSSSIPLFPGGPSVCSAVIGATGELTRGKIFAAIFALYYSGFLFHVHEYAILLNLGSLQAISMKDCVLIFEYNRKGGQAFLESLLPRLNPKNSNGGLSMPFELEIWLQLAYSWMRFSEEIKEILGTIVKHKVLLVSNEKINFFLFKFIMRKTCILFAYV